MAAELARVLKRTGRYDVSELARRTGRHRRSVCRVLNGGPVSEAYVEELAKAAGIDEAYLYPEAPRQIPEALRLLIA